MKRFFLLSVAFIIFTSPSALAAWWDPTSWFDNGSGSANVPALPNSSGTSTATSDYTPIQDVTPFPSDGGPQPTTPQNTAGTTSGMATTPLFDTPTPPEQSADYGKSCAGYADLSGDTSRSYTGTCIRSSICSGRRLLYNPVSGSGSGVTFTNCTNTPGLVCCASQDIPTDSGTTTPSSGTASSSNAGGGSSVSQTSSVGGSQANTAATSSNRGWTAGKQRILGFGLPNRTISGIVTNIVWVLLILLGLASTIAFIWAGFKYLLAAGDEKQAGEAKSAIKYSITGITVALAGVIIINAVTNLLSANGYF